MDDVGTEPLVRSTDGALREAGDLYDRAPCGLFSTRADGVITHVNTTFADLIGHPGPSLLGRRFADLLTAGTRIFYETHYSPLLRLQGSVREIAVELIRVDGSRLFALLNSVVDHDERGQPMSIRTSVFDATERRTYEAELFKALEIAQAAEREVRVLALTLQASLLPPSLPEIPGIDIAAAFRPAGTGVGIGGDFYDVFETPRANWAIAIGDVCGKGPEAAIVTALARHTIRAAAMRSARPATILAALNEALRAQAPDTLCTAAHVHVRGRRDGGVTGRIASGGHPPPLIVQTNGEIRHPSRGGQILGCFATPVLHDTDFHLSAGESLVLYTDGVTEARRGRDFFGDDGLQALLARGTPQDTAARITTRIVDEVLGLQDGTPRDDIAVVVLKAIR